MNYIMETLIIIPKMMNHSSFFSYFKYFEVDFVLCNSQFS
jgi:hypothetical protein